MLGSFLKSPHDQLHQLHCQVIILWSHSALLISAADIIVKIAEINKYFKYVSKDDKIWGKSRNIFAKYVYPVGVNISKLK
jgi:hypothetical protein